MLSACILLGPVENKAGNLAITRLSFQIFTRSVCWSAGADNWSCFSSQCLGKALRSVLGPRTSEVCGDRVFTGHGNCAPVTHVGTEFSWTMAYHSWCFSGLHSIMPAQLPAEHPALSKEFGPFLSVSVAAWLHFPGTPWILLEIAALLCSLLLVYASAMCRNVTHIF